jgi:hypothetical protein
MALYAVVNNHELRVRMQDKMAALIVSYGRNVFDEDVFFEPFNLVLGDARGDLEEDCPEDALSFMSLVWVETIINLYRNGLLDAMTSLEIIGSLSETAVYRL